MDFNLYNLVKTTRDVDILKEEIDILIDSLYRTESGSFENVVTNSIRKETANELKTIGSSRSEMRSELEKIKSDLGNLNVFRITLAFQPVHDDLDKIITWIRSNIGPQVVLDVVFDESVIGGAIIEYKGIYADMSLRKKLDNTDFSKFL
jgi:F0F1-type ATP synthase delta subunit